MTDTPTPPLTAVQRLSIEASKAFSLGLLVDVYPQDILEVLEDWSKRGAERDQVRALADDLAEGLEEAMLAAYDGRYSVERDRWKALLARHAASKQEGQ